MKIEITKSSMKCGLLKDLYEFGTVSGWLAAIAEGIDSAQALDVDVKISGEILPALRNRSRTNTYYDIIAKLKRLPIGFDKISNGQLVVKYNAFDRILLIDIGNKPEI